MMSDQSQYAADDARVGVAIAEYLEAIDSRRALDIETWLTRYEAVRAELLLFLADQSKMKQFMGNGLPDLPPDKQQSSADDSTHRHGSASYYSTRKDLAPEPLAKIELGGQLGPYHLVSELGHGGMGRVYAARHQELGRMVALKLMINGDRADESERRRFRREAEAVAKLDHVGIVPIFEVGQHQGWDYFTMKLLPGGSLRDWMNDAADISFRTIAEVIAATALGLQHAHQRGILHRDLKPSNVLLDEQQNPYLVDFGLAKQLVQEQTTLGHVVGTPAYMSPEQLYGEATTLSDVYGLGATLYSLLTKRVPFFGKTLTELSEQIRQHAPLAPRTMRAGIPVDLEVICLKCMAKEPERRYISAADLAADLQRWLNGESILARPTSWQTRVWMLCRRHPVVSSLVVALGLVVVAATITLSLLLNESKRLEREAKILAQQSSANAELAQSNAKSALAAAAEATSQRDRARQILDTMTSTVAYEWLAGQGPLTDRQQVFLKQNVEYYRELVAEGIGGEDLEQRLWLAKVQQQLAAMLGRLGERHEALELMEQANETLSRIPADWETLRVLTIRSKVLHDLQAWLADTGQLPRSLAVMQEERDVLDHIFELDSENWEAAQRLGQLKIDLGMRYRFTRQLPEALQILQEAVDFNRLLVVQQPDTTVARRQLGIGLRTLGLAQMQAQEYAAAEQSMLAALEIQRPLAKETTYEWRLQADVAYTLDNLGVVRDRQGDLAGATEYIRQAIDQRRQLIQLLPGEEPMYRALTQTMLNLASILKRQADWVGRRDLINQTLEQAKQAQARFPNVVEYRCWEWMAKLGLAENFSQAEDYEAALAILNEVIPLIMAAQSDPVSRRTLHNQLLRAWNARAPIFSARGQHELAMADWQSCINQTQGIELANHRLCQGIALVKAGQTEQAREIMNIVTEELPPDASHPMLVNLHYNFACIRSLIAEKTDDPDERQSLLSQATESVAESLKLGWQPINRLRTDHDLLALQDYAAFEVLLSEWETRTP